MAAGLGSDFLYGGSGDDVLQTLSGGLLQGGPGDDHLDVLEPPEQPLRVRCGAGRDVGGAAAGATTGTDCEWLGIFSRFAVRRPLRASGRHIRLRLRDVRVGHGRLVVRDLRTGRQIGVGRWSGPRGTLRLSRAAARRVRRAGTLAVTIEDPTFDITRVTTRIVRRRGS